MYSDGDGGEPVSSPPPDGRRITHLQAIASADRLGLLRLLAERREELKAELREEVEAEMRERQETGIVEVRPARQRGEPPEVTVSDVDRMYEFGETLPGILLAPEGSPAAADWPLTWESPARAVANLTVVHGDRIGRSFPLEIQPGAGPSRWAIGRGDVDVPLEEDPYVCAQAGEIDRTPDGFELADLRTADRRLSLNGQKLARGESRELAEGDLVGVGRTLLRFEP